MKTITLTQPHATLVALNEKRVETRSWATSHRGNIAIHAAKGFPKDARALCRQPIFAEVLERAGYNHPDDLPLGAVIATCNLISVKQMNELHVFPACQSYTTHQRTWPLNEQERAFGYYAVGRWMWLLDAIVKFNQPIPARGYQRIWNWEYPSANQNDSFAVGESAESSKQAK